MGYHKKCVFINDVDFYSIHDNLCSVILIPYKESELVLTYKNGKNRKSLSKKVYLPYKKGQQVLSLINRGKKISALCEVSYHYADQIPVKLKAITGCMKIKVTRAPYEQQNKIQAAFKRWFKQFEKWKKSDKDGEYFNFSLRKVLLKKDSKHTTYVNPMCVVIKIIKWR